MALKDNSEENFDFNQFTKRASLLNVDIERYRADICVAASSAKTPREQAISVAEQFACNTLINILQSGNYQPKEIVEILKLVVNLATTLYNFGVSDGISEATKNTRINNASSEMQT